MKRTKIDRSQANQDSSRKNNFDGEVHMQRIVGPNDSKEVELLAVFFGTGARTKPHTHQHDQVLQIIEGQGVVATENEKLIVSPGDVITIPAGTWHWHGATRTSAMCHISIKRAGPSNWEVEQKNWASGYDE